MEGRREEYLASRVPKPIAHIAEVEESPPDVEESTLNNEEVTLHNEFAAMSLGTSNNILFSTYALSSFSENITEHFALSSISHALTLPLTQPAQTTFSKIAISSTHTTPMVPSL